MSNKDDKDKNIFNDQSPCLKRKQRFDSVIKAAREQRSEEYFGLKWTLKAVLVSFLFLGVIFYLAEAEKNPNLISVNDVIKRTGVRSKWMTLTGTKNILVLGVDSNGRMTDPFFGTRSDTIIVLSIDKFAKSINAISIPRDSKVFLAKGQGTDKINAAHALGGADLSVKTIEETFGIDVSNYVVVNYEGIREFVRTIGGVSINVEKRMYYRDRTAGLKIDLKPGYQLLNAEQAEGYLRFRHDTSGDIGRIRRQQWFLKAVLKKLKSGEAILKAPELIEILSKNVKTDLNLFEISKILRIAGKIRPENIQVATLPGKPSKYGAISYWILDTDKAQTIIDRLIYREDPDEDSKEITISLFYPSQMAGRIDNIVDNIHSAGFIVKFRAQENNHFSQIVAHTKRAAFSKVKSLKKEIPELGNSQYVVEPDESLYPYTDFTIIIGDQ